MTKKMILIFSLSLIFNATSANADNENPPAWISIPVVKKTEAPAVAEGSRPEAAGQYLGGVYVPNQQYVLASDKSIPGEVTNPGEETQPRDMENRQIVDQMEAVGNLDLLSESDDNQLAKDGLSNESGSDELVLSPEAGPFQQKVFEILLDPKFSVVGGRFIARLFLPVRPRNHRGVASLANGESPWLPFVTGIAGAWFILTFFAGRKTRDSDSDFSDMDY